MSSPPSLNPFAAASIVPPSPGPYHAAPQTSARPLPRDQAVLVETASSQKRTSSHEDSLSPLEDWEESTLVPSPPTLPEGNAPSSPELSVPISRLVNDPPSPRSDCNSGEGYICDVGEQSAFATVGEVSTRGDHIAAPASTSSSPSGTASDDEIAVILWTPGDRVPVYIVRQQDPDCGRLFLALLQQADTVPTIDSLCIVEPCDPPYSTSVTVSVPASSAAAYAPSSASSAMTSAVSQPAILASVLLPDSAGNAEALSPHAETGIPQSGETEATECV